MKTFQFNLFGVTLLALSAQGALPKISTPADRMQTIDKAEILAAWAPHETDKIVNPFISRPDPEAERNREANTQQSSKDAIGSQILQSLNPSGVLRKGDEAYLQLPRGAKKVGDLYTVTIGKTEHVIQLSRIGTDDFDFTYQGKTFSRLIKNK